MACICACWFLSSLSFSLTPPFSPHPTAPNISLRSFLCTQPEGENVGLATCTAQLTMATAWHKTSALSSVAMSFWTSTEFWDTEVYNREDRLGGFNIVSPVITGRSGAWPKVDAFSNVGITFVPVEEGEELVFPYILNIAYKVGAA